MQYGFDWKSLLSFFEMKKCYFFTYFLLILVICCDVKGVNAGSLDLDTQRYSVGGLTGEKYSNNYRNAEYLYSLLIPEGLTCESDSPPSPNHGCRINLSSNQESYIWITGYYNSADSLSPSDELLRMMDNLIKDGMEIIILKRTICSLSNLPGERLAVKIKNINYSQATESKVEDKVVSFRLIKGYGEIIYTIGLVTSESRYESDKKFFELILQSWKIEQPLNKRE